MIRNYLKIAWRNIWLNKKTSIINILGLSVGMAVAALVGLWIWDEVSFDKYHENYDRVAQVRQNQTFDGKTTNGSAISIPLANALRTTHKDQFEYIALASWDDEHLLNVGDKQLIRVGMFIEKDGPKIFSLKMIQGNQNSLAAPDNIIVSEATAKSLFGTTDVLNKVLKLDNKFDVKITGVYGDLPSNTTFRDEAFFAHWDIYKTSENWIVDAATDWGNNSFQCFAQINDKTSFATANKLIKDIKKATLSENEKSINPEIVLHPMEDWHLRSSFKNGVLSGGQIIYVRMFGIIGIFVLLLACINFMNLSTARSEKRAKEVGIRKTIGSGSGELIGQFLIESILITFIAFLISIMLVVLALPWFNGVAGKAISIPWSSPWFWLIGFGFVIVTGLLAGSYPAFYLSSFQPLKVLKGTFKTGKLAAMPRRVMVVLQFTVSVALIIGTVIVYKQIQFSKDRPMGYDNNNLVSIYMRTQEFYGKYDLLRDELKKQGAIIEMAESSSPVTDVWSHNSFFNWEGRNASNVPDFATFWVTHEFGKTVGLQMLEGRDFSRDFGMDSSAVILNEAAVEYMGLKDPVGKIIYRDNIENQIPYTVIGVVKNMVMESPYEPVKQALYFLDPNNVNVITLKLNPEKSTSSSLAIVEDVFKKAIPSVPFAYQFVDKVYEQKFLQEQKVGKLAGVFTILAILISCLGLFGLTSFIAEQRTKEIGIRKIIGASVFSLWKLLSKDFVMLIAIACVIAIPLALYFLNGWLQNYEYRVGVSWWVILAAVLGALFIAVLTISIQTIAAARANPVKSLRTE